jgi:hypothetical protein
MKDSAQISALAHDFSRKLNGQGFTSQTTSALSLSEEGTEVMRLLENLS